MHSSSRLFAKLQLSLFHVKIVTHMYGCPAAIYIAQSLACSSLDISSSIFIVYSFSSAFIQGTVYELHFHGCVKNRAELKTHTHTPAEIRALSFAKHSKSEKGSNGNGKVPNKKKILHQKVFFFCRMYNRFHKFSFGFSVNDLSVLYCSTATINTRVIKCSIYMFDVLWCRADMFMHRIVWSCKQGSKCFEWNKTEHAVAKLALFQRSDNKAHINSPTIPTQYATVAMETREGDRQRGRGME